MTNAHLSNVSKRAAARSAGIQATPLTRAKAAALAATQISHAAQAITARRSRIAYKDRFDHFSL
jgi:adenylosuccinate lyase